MKFDKPRVFEANYPGHGIYRVEIASDHEAGVARHISNGNVGVVWTLSELLENPHFWKEVTPFDVTKLDTAGVFHEVPEKAPVMRHYYRKDDPDYILSNPGPLIDRQSQFIEFPRPDIANATIAELRAALAKFVNIDPEFSADRDYVWVEGTGAVALDYTDEVAELRARVAELEGRIETVRKLREHEIAELRRQKDAAWMRGDYVTGDRIADLIDDKRPSEHEAADSKAEVRA